MVVEVMNNKLIERHFAKMGAVARVHSEPRRNAAGAVTIDIGQNGGGEFFDIALAPAATTDLKVIDVQPRIRHLLLMSQQADGKHKFLCGHDERHWFVAAVPERASVSSVKTAMEALKPAVVRHRENQLQVKPRKRNRRRNEAFVRQGEWFFVPITRGIHVDTRVVLRNEPISRGNGGKPHYCEELIRQGGELVYVSRRYRQGLTEQRYRQLLTRQPELRKVQWIAQRRNPLVLVRGKVRHRDHKTIVLRGWHQVLMNTETQSEAMRHVAFID